MSVADFSAVRPEAQRALGRAFIAARLKGLLDKGVTLWILVSGLTFLEPSPYEFMFALVFPLALFAGLKVYRSTGLLFILAMIFAPFGLIAAFQPVHTPVTTALIYPAITIFLMVSAAFVASYVAEAPQERVRRIMRAFTIIALFSATIGTLGYLGLIPGAYELLTRSQRAKALFEDPNVYGPFLIVPAMYATQRIFLGKSRAILGNGLIILVLLIGVFASFSRAAWGNMLGSAIILFLLVFTLEANARDKVRMIIVGMVGIVTVLVALGALLSIPSVGALFQERAQVEQSYDSGETGRLGRQGYAFDVGLSNPFGIGPAEFPQLQIIEEAHDSYATSLHVYGWGGALIWNAMLVLTFVRMFTVLFKPSPNRRLLLPLVAVFISLVVEAGIIDIDHWRHYYLVMGLIWGIAQGFQTIKPGESKITALV